MSSKYFPEAYANVQAAMDGQASESGFGWVQQFEAAFAAKLEVPFAVATNSGTSAIHAGLAALGVQPGDEVISPALTVVMDSFCTLYLGATPVFADVDERTWNIDPDDVKRKISSRTKAIIVVSWFGAPVDMEPFHEISAQFGIPVLDDSAETLLARNPAGKYSGTDASIGVFSFEEKKHLTTGGEGGMLVTADPELAERARKFAGLGYRHLTASAGRTSLDAAVFQNPDYERFSDLGLNYRMTPITAAIGLGQLAHLDEIVQRRKTCAELFLAALDGCSWLIPQVSPSNSDHAYYSLGLKYEGFEAVGATWVDFYEEFRSRGGDGFYGNCLNPFREPVFRHLGLEQLSKSALKSCPVAVGLQPRIMAMKTNYRSLQDARVQADILYETISEISSG